MPIKILFFLLLIPCCSYSQNYTLKILEQPYQELNDATILCKDTIPRRKYFTLEEPMSVFNEQVDSIFIVDLKVLHICLGNKKSKEFDMFVPLSCPIKKLKIDTTGFTISYKITGEVGKRKLIIQWKGVRPDYTYSASDAINLQVIIDEENNTISYAYGKLLPFLDLILSVWGNNRQLSIYFVDNLKGFNDVKYSVKYIQKDFFEPHDFVLNSAFFSGGPFSDSFIASKTPFDLDDIEIKEGLVFEMGIAPNSMAEIIKPSIVIYPNPASKELHILSEESMKTYYEILNTAGVTKQSGIIENNFINIEQLGSGLHFLKWVSEKGEVHVGKFVKL